VQGPFSEGQKDYVPPALDSNGEVKKAPNEVLKDAAEEAASQAAPGKKPAQTVAAPSLNDTAKKAHWAQVFSTFQQVGSSSRAMEYAQSLKKVRAGLQELFLKYKEGLSQEDLLLQTAYTEALEAYRAASEVAVTAGDGNLMMASSEMMMDEGYQQAIQMQMTAHQQLENDALEINRNVQGAHHKADLSQKTYEAKIGRSSQKLPRRLGVGPCKFFMKTGDCAYGQTCKWDHPTEALPQNLLRPGSNQPGME
jgi:hypothetical protein